jgi:O-acetyl-ADP-ribose deacetylase (regulator of RNase III)
LRKLTPAVATVAEIVEAMETENGAFPDGGTGVVGCEDIVSNEVCQYAVDCGIS